MLIVYFHLVLANVCIFLAFSYISYTFIKDSTFEHFTRAFVEFTTFKASGVISSWYESSVLFSAVGLYATFGPTIDSNGKRLNFVSQTDNCKFDYYNQDYNSLSGELLYISNNACNKSKILEEVNRKLKGNLTSDIIILNERGGCSFLEKVRNFQQVPNVKAVIIGNNIREQNLLVMKTDQSNSKVIIPSFFVSNESLEKMKISISKEGKKTLNIRVKSTKTKPLFQLIALLYLPLILALMIIFAVLVSLCKFQPTISCDAYIYKNNSLIPKEPVAYHLGNIIENLASIFKNLGIRKSRNNLCNLLSRKDSYNSGLSDTSFTSFQSNSDDDSEVSSNVSVELVEVKMKSMVNKAIDWISYNLKSSQSIEVPNKYRTQRCAICLEKFRILKSCVSILSCNHVFHYDCCSKWSEINYNCPICQSKVISD